MNGFKDFFYKTNDILLAVLVILLACGVIAWRMDVIMDYPNTITDDGVKVSEEAKEQEKNKEATASKTQKTEKNETQQDKPATEETSSGVYTNGHLSNDVTVEVKSGSAMGAADRLVQAGLFKSWDDYVSVCNAAGVTPENIKATTFTFPAGSTQADIAKKVTQ